ncbi:uncharacterized protein SOCE26_044070 [Sorangium cellulosum]|uniref:Uncharacterized protein n=1 Tax=Sorangium cellulosum TaxID=56 RepID=A0A2L0EUJ4_SORCE|nr:hypothetical protein [Sorangium cellulosum]AUX42967.1 uncharacterized protein SOCE26_044070 [Sorangium cellulosum]
MRQLSLFDDRALTPAPVPLDGAAGLLAGDGAPAGQLDLFAQRTLRLSLAAEAVAAGELGEARRLLAEVAALRPADADVRRQADRVAALERQLGLAGSSASPAAALLEVARGLDPATGAFASLRRVLLRRVAEALRGAEGDDGRLEGQPPGYYWLEAGDVAEAHGSLARAAEARRSARTLCLLADAATSLGDPAARRLYLEALLRDPYDAALAAARDEGVRGLPDVARYELEIEEEPRAWSAPVGIVTGVLPPPLGLALDEVVSGAPLPGGPPRSPGQEEALARARRFVAALAAASSREARRSGEAVIEARRAMKQLAPALFAAYMARGSGALQSR